MTTPLAKRIPYPTVLEVGERDPTIMARVLNNAVAGNLNVIGQMTVKAGTTETRLNDPRISPQSFFCWQSLIDPGAGPHTSTTMWLKERGVRTALIGHDAPPVDVVVEYAVFG
jgi:hypothetical protein